MRANEPYRIAGRRATAFLAAVRKGSSPEDNPLYTGHHNLALSLFGQAACESPIEAKHHFWKMHKECGPKEKPNVETLNTVLTVLSSNPKTQSEVFPMFRIVNDAEEFDFKANLKTIRIVLYCLENIGTWEAGKRAEALLKEVEEENASAGDM